MTTVALTGATGFIGKVLLSHLQGQGYQIKALYRPSSTAPPLPTPSLHWQAGSLEDRDSLRKLIEQCDVVVHCAGAVRGATLEQFKEVNVAGVVRIAEAAAEQQASRFLLISSLAAREPSLSAYAASKRMGEDALASTLGDRMSWDIVRPPAVYGPGDREMLPLLRLIRRGVVPVIGHRNARFSLLYVDDLADAVCGLLQSAPASAGRHFELHDGHPDGYTWPQIAAIAADLNGKEPFCLSIPRPLMQSVAQANALLARLLGYRPMLTPGKVREIFHPDWACDNSAISGAIGWQPRVSFREGMKRLFDQGA